MAELVDYSGRAIRLTDERLPTSSHPEMRGLIPEIEATLAEPDRVLRSLSDVDIHLYYRQLQTSRFGEKLVCIVVKLGGAGGFVITAYLTDKIKRGVALWSKS